jgi:hypothetical protein
VRAEGDEVGLSVDHEVTLSRHRGRAPKRAETVVSVL